MRAHGNDNRMADGSEDACHRDPEAQARLICRYPPIILRVVRRYLHPELRRLFDSIGL